MEGGAMGGTAKKGGHNANDDPKDRHPKKSLHLIGTKNRLQMGKMGGGHTQNGGGAGGGTAKMGGGHTQKWQGGQWGGTAKKGGHNADDDEDDPKKGKGAH